MPEAHSAWTREAGRDGQISVFDDFLSSTQIARIARSLELADYSSYQIKDGALFYNLFQARLDPADFRKSPIYGFIERHVVARYLGEEFEMTQVFCNAFRYGESLFRHTDRPRLGKRLKSFVYCVNDQWESNWGGETVFFDEEGDATACIGFRPGRLYLFDGAISHRPGAPTRICGRHRLSLNIRFEDLG